MAALLCATNFYRYLLLSPGDQDYYFGSYDMRYQESVGWNDSFVKGYDCSLWEM